MLDTLLCFNELHMYISSNGIVSRITQTVLGRWKVGLLVWPLTHSQNVELGNNRANVVKVLWLKMWLTGCAQVVKQ